MTTETQNLLNTINLKLQAKPLIYFCREAERALGLEKHLTNYHICCVEDSYIVDQLIGQNVSVFCLERSGEVISEKSTSTLISHPKTLEWLKSITNNSGFYALTFLPTKNIKYKIEQLGGVLLNVDYALNQKFENKISQLEEFKNNQITIPKNLKGEIQNFDYKALATELSNNFVVQTSKDHTGGGTYFINSEEEFNTVKSSLAGNLVRFSQKVNGQALTINILINAQKYFISTPQYQITGIKELTSGEGSTVGNDFSYGAQIINTSPTLKSNLENELKKVSEMMLKNSYQGIFGVDMIIDNDNVYIIEINARQTANIPFQTKLEILQDRLPLMLMHIATFLGISLDNYNYENLNTLEGSQLFLRAKQDNTKIVKEVKSGVYRLQSDNAAVDSNNELKDHTILIDEEKDMPLIFQQEGYSVVDASGGFILICQREGNSKNLHEELARMQFKNGIVNDGNIAPWILKAFEVIEAMLLH